MDNKTVQGGGISFFGLLTVVFIALKLTDVISWSWFWILSPLFLPLLLIIAISLIGLVLAFIISGITKILEGTDEDEDED